MADFYCPAAKLVIEIDGMVHDHDQVIARDNARDEYLRLLGLEVIQIRAIEVLANPVAIADGLVRLFGPSTSQLR